MAPSKYEMVPASEDDVISETDIDEEENERAPLVNVEPVTVEEDPRFHQPTPSPYKRALLLIFTAFLFWLAISMRRNVWQGTQKAKVVHANRYSKDYKFRPAASPVVTETLKDGRVRVRGAQPTEAPVIVSSPSAKVATPKRASKKGKRKGTKKKNVARS